MGDNNWQLNNIVINEQTIVSTIEQTSILH